MNDAISKLVFPLRLIWFSTYILAHEVASNLTAFKKSYSK